MNYEPIIGLEVHIQLKTRSKMFCTSPNAESDVPNAHICEVCTGQPGTLPVINREAVKKALMVGLALNCEIAEYSKFDRKNYFYPDLPKGYQISQFDMPLNGKGEIELVVNGEKRVIGITRAHLEEDAGKLLHPAGENYSLVDYNRAGTPLLEIVSEPDIRTAEEAKIYLQNLQNIARYLGVSDADMEKGHLRCDVNISLRKPGQKGFPPYKIEVKNLNSFRAVANAIEYEIKRQTEALDNGEKLPTETRGWVDDKGITVSQRSKEESQDYRYFPEPDLPMLHFTKEFLAELKRELPEIPDKRKERFKKEYKISIKQIELLVSDKEFSDFYEEVISESLENFKESNEALSEEKQMRFNELVANWMIHETLRLLYEKNIKINDSKVTPENFAELMILLSREKISGLAAKQVLAKMYDTGEHAPNIVAALGLEQVSDERALLEAVRKVISANPKAVEDAKANPKSIGFLVGQAMKELKGKGNPQMVNDLVKKELEI